MDKTSQLIVKRPSGVWNSRAPFNDYLIRRRRVLRTYNCLALVIHSLSVEAKTPAIIDRSAGNWLKATRGEAGIFWREYRRTLPRTSADPDDLPGVTAGEFGAHLNQASYDIRRDALVMHAGVFESYTQCWALNILLAKLEKVVPLLPAERRLAESFSPERDSDAIPTVPRILQSISMLEEGLAKLPAFVSPKADQQFDLIDQAQSSAVDAIKFWRAVRNSIVHRGGMVSARFVRRHYRFIQELSSRYPYMEPILAGSGFHFYNDIVRAMAAVHYKSAKWMNEQLEQLSSGLRGHVNAPNAPLAESFFPGQIRSPPLLMEGDHHPSYRWASDASFRTATRLPSPS